MSRPAWAVARDIAERIKQLRDALSPDPDAPLSQADLARRAGVRPSQVSQWERGVQRPSRSRLERWAEREGWPVTIFAEGAAPPAEALGRGAGVGAAGRRAAAAAGMAEEGAAGGARAEPAGSARQAPDEILARFYRLMALAAESGRPYPPELAALMHAMYRWATAGAEPRAAGDPVTGEPGAEPTGEQEAVPEW